MQNFWGEEKIHKLSELTQEVEEYSSSELF